MQFANIFEQVVSLDFSVLQLEVHVCSPETSLNMEVSLSPFGGGSIVDLEQTTNLEDGNIALKIMEYKKGVAVIKAASLLDLLEKGVYYSSYVFSNMACEDTVKYLESKGFTAVSKVVPVEMHHFVEGMLSAIDKNGQKYSVILLKDENVSFDDLLDFCDEIKVDPIVENDFIFYADDTKVTLFDSNKVNVVVAIEDDSPLFFTVDSLMDGKGALELLAANGGFLEVVIMEGPEDETSNYPLKGSAKSCHVFGTSKQTENFLEFFKKEWECNPVITEGNPNIKKVYDCQKGNDSCRVYVVKENARFELENGLMVI